MPRHEIPALPSAKVIVAKVLPHVDDQLAVDGNALLHVQAMLSS